MTEIVKMRKSGVIVGRPGLTVRSPGVVRIDRETNWGNPHHMQRRTAEERERVVKLYKRDLRLMAERGLWTRAQLAELHGKKLACWCAPLACHGDALAQAAAAAAGPDADWERWLGAKTA